MSDAVVGARKSGSVIPFVLAGLSFIPLIGVLFGAVAIAWGLLNLGRRGALVAAIGGGGIAFTVLLYGGLFYFGFVQRDGIYDHLRDQMAQSELNDLVPQIEFYRLETGAYPESLEAVKDVLPKNSFGAISVYDPRNMISGEQTYFYYAKAGADHYYLRGVAPDGKPFSTGALVPQVKVNGTGLGLLLSNPPVGLTPK